MMVLRCFSSVAFTLFAFSTEALVEFGGVITQAWSHPLAKWALLVAVETSSTACLILINRATIYARTCLPGKGGGGGEGLLSIINCLDEPIVRRLLKHLDNNNLLSANQSAYRSFQSMETVIL